MKMHLITPAWGHPWVEGYKKVCEERGHEFKVSDGKHLSIASETDVVIHAWADGRSTPLPGAYNIMFMRRYELFAVNWSKFDWDNIDLLICVNDWIAGVVYEYFKEKGIDTPIQVIYNGVDPGKWTYAERKPGPRIGMACHVHPKKNLPMALQILANLPEEYELHIAGAIQDSCTAEYLNDLAKRMKRKLYLYGHVEDMDGWWEMMNFCLSTSISEGNPNNVNEAMMKGIKPVVHEWPGAHKQYPIMSLFRVTGIATEIILNSAYDSSSYRVWAMNYFGPQNWEYVIEIAESFLNPGDRPDNINHTEVMP